MKFQALFKISLAGAIGLSACLSAVASPKISLDKFKAMPVLDGGRVKPLDTYARVTLMQLSARSAYKGQAAVEWLARVMFTPKDAMDDKVFRINNPDVVYSIGVEPQSDSRYTFAQISPAISKLSDLADAAMKVDEKKRTPVESEIIRVANNLSVYVGISNAFLFAIPSPDFKVTDTATAKALGLDPRPQPYSYMDIRGHMGQMASLVQPLMAGENGGPGARDPTTWSSAEMGAYHLFQNFTNWTQHYRDFPPALIPPMEKGSEMWIGPWSLVGKPNMDPEVKAAIQSLHAMASAYIAGQPEEFDQAVTNITAFTGKLGAGLVNPTRIKLELAYNALDPFYLTKILLGFAILGALIGMMVMRKWIYWPTVFLLIAAALIQGAGLALRVAISGRAPVSNLFETFLFVSWVGGVLGLALEFFNRKGFGVLVGSMTGFLVLLLSGRYDTDGDTIGVLVAVLNSNFWLSTHVITISLGYAGMCLAGVLGHFYIIQRAWNNKAGEKLDAMIRMTYAILAFGLIFSFIGTVLGGVWADQSWGRFWGWDPKENGALMIVLWGSILFHAKVGKMIGALGMAVGAVLGIIVVMMAWFGINLLGVGLHSYGFTTGVATALSAYVGGEAVFLAAMLYLVKRADAKSLPT